MGFDVYGLKPNNEPKPDTPDWSSEDDKAIKAYFAWQENTPGAYFRMNVWGWHPLWDFVHNHCQDIFEMCLDEFEDDVDTLDKMYSTCHHNDGFIVPVNVARKMAQRLYDLDKIGILDETEVSQDMEIERMTMVNCKVCDGTGTRKGWEGWQSEDTWLKTHPSLVTKNKAKEELYKILDKAAEEGIKGLGTGEISFKWANEMKGCNMCHGIGKVKPFEANYKIKAEYIREFAKFCDKSGGFQIW